MAFEDALACRGVVMLGVGGVDTRAWVAVCSAVDGTLEIRCGEPPRARWPRSRAAEGWGRLGALGFLPRIDALVRGVEDEVTGIELLVRALREGHDASEDAPLERILVHPGFLPAHPPPPPDAPLRDHVETALVTLVRVGEGDASFEVGLPARPWALAHVADDALELQLERDYDREEPTWRVPLEAGVQRERAREIVAGAEPPLFISLMNLPHSAVRSS